MIENIYRKTKFSCGYDIPVPYDIDLKPGEWVTIDTGLKLDGLEKAIWRKISKTRVNEKDLCEYSISNVCDSWFMLIVPRSGIGTRNILRLANTVGIIDQDYRDTIKATVTVDVPLSLKAGDRFLQGILIPFLRLDGEIEPEMERNGGYGSTGL